MSQYIIHFKNGTVRRFKACEQRKHLIHCDVHWKPLNDTGWTLQAINKAESIKRIEQPVRNGLAKLGDDHVQ